MILVSENYEQLKKNDVKATNQVPKNIFFENPDGNDVRVLILGNSITYHSALSDIGWNNNFGMAASSKEKDYVHRLYSMVKEKQPDAAFCLCQAAEWEYYYKTGRNLVDKYSVGKDFNADIIIVRIIENCPADKFDSESFKQELTYFLDYLNNSKNAKIILSTGFWKHPGNAAMCELAQEKNYPLVHLEDLGEDDNMKAIGKFEHFGVANHPGDLGMENIAKRLFEQVKDLI